MPGKEIIQSLFWFTPRVTITTAHAKYCSLAYRSAFGVPLHFFSTFASPENYLSIPFKDKGNVILFSPDDDEKNLEVMEIIKVNFPDYELQVIKGLKYEDYKSLIARAKWSLTFGEGLDFYFIESVFSGSISFAIFNDLFFTADFEGLSTVFDTYDALKEGIVRRIRQLDNEVAYEEYQKQLFHICAKYYSKEQYRKNVVEFYKGEYTYV